MSTTYGVFMRNGVNFSHDTAESISYSKTIASVAVSNVQDALDQVVDSYALNTTATTASAGLMPALGTSTTKYLRNDGTWNVPNNTTYAVMTSGTTGLVPSGGTSDKYLKGNATWDVPENTTYDVFTSVVKGLAPTGGTSTKYLRGDATWQTTAAINTTYGTVTTATDGLMLSSDKAKLDNYPDKGSDTTKFLRNDGQWAVPPDTTYANVSTAAAGLAPKVTNTANFLKGDGTWAVPINTTYAVMTSGTTGLVPSGGTNAKYLRGDATWQTTAAINTTYGAVTTATDGLMTSTDKIKLNSYPDQGTDTTKYLRNDGQWAVPPDTTYAVMTSGTTGLVPSGGTNAKYLRGDATWQTTAAFNTTYGVMTSGTTGLVPTGGTSDTFLRGDATWVAPTDTTYAVMTSGTTGLVPSGGTSAKYLRGDATWQTTAAFNTTYGVMTSGTTGLVPASGTSAKYLRGDATWQTTAAFNTTYGVMTSGTTGLVPTGGTSTKFLRGDATWQLPNNTTYAIMTSGTTGLVPSGGTNDKYLRGDATWETPPNDNTTYPVMTSGTSGLVPASGTSAKYLRGDATWQTTAAINTTYGAATTAAAGLLSAADKITINSLKSAAFKDVTNTYSASGTDPVSGQAVAEALSQLPEPMKFKGTVGTGGTVTALPVDGSAAVGDTYKVITDGTYAGQTARVGDTFICETKTSSANTWTYIPSGDEPGGTVTNVTIKATSPIVVDTTAAITSSGTRTLSHANSGATAGSYGDSAAQTPGYGGTFKVPYVTVNATGHVTGISEHTVTIPASDNTDANVTQTVTNGTDADYRVLLSGTANDSTLTEGARKDKDFKYNPAKDTLYVGGIDAKTVNSVLKADSIFDAPTNTKIAANATAIIQSPIPKYLWHDVFAFCRAATPTYYVSADNETWTEDTLNKKHFACLDSLNISIIKATGQSGSRWLWNSTNFSYSSGAWLVLGVAYTSSMATVTITYETCDDGETWVTRHTSTHNATSAPIWCRISNYGGDRYHRLTITKDPTDTTKSCSIGAIKLLTARWGDQGRGSEGEFPYNWDENGIITKLGTGASLGTTNNKWDGYFNSINGIAVGASPKFTDTTYAVMSSGTTGLVPSGGTNAKYLRGDATWQTPDNTTYAVMTSGTTGLVPTGGTSTKYLRGDATWQTPDNTTYAVMTSGTTGLVPASGTSTKYLRGDATWQTTASFNTTYGTVSTAVNGLAPKVTSTANFLKGDGTWAVPTDTTYAVMTSGTTGLVPSGGTNAKYLRGDATWQTTASFNTTYANVSTAAAGLAPKVTNTANFLKGDGTWAVPTDTTYAVMTSGTSGLVPTGGTNAKYLRGDATWQTTAAFNTTYGAATTAANGLMSSTDKTKLDNYPDKGSDTTKYLRNDGQWTVPPDTTYGVFTTAANGLTPSGGTSAKYLRGDATWQTTAAFNTTYGTVTTAANGLMTSTDKIKLNSYPDQGSDTTKYLRNDGQWAVPPDTTYGVFTTTANGLAPKVTNTSNFLKGDGTWAVPTNTTYAVMTSGTTGLVPSGGTNAKYLRGDATWQTTAAFNTTYGVMTSGTSGLVPASGTSAKYLRGDASWQTPNDTKNTAGSTDTSSKIFLIGATSQGANPQTYSDDEIFATDGVLTTKKVQIGGTSAATIQYNNTNQCIEFVFA